MPDQEQAHLFATYIELTRENNSGSRRRQQYVLLPPMPRHHAPPGSDPVLHPSYFYREQRNEAHRAIWGYHPYLANDEMSIGRWLGNRVEAASNVGWDVSPVITCEVHPTELAEVLRERKTPYRLLRRLAKVAKSMHRLDIT